MKSLSELYQEFLQWRANNPDSIYIVFREDIHRYIVTKGVELYRFFGDVVVYTIRGEEQLHEPITCKDARQAWELCDKLNAQYVHDNEPEKFAKNPNWQALYSKQIHCGVGNRIFQSRQQKKCAACSFFSQKPANLRKNKQIFSR